MSDADLLYMGAAAKRNSELEELLRECLPVLKRAFFANYHDQRKCEEIMDKIKKVVGGAE